MQIDEIYPGMIFSVRKPFDPDDPWSEVCGVVRAHRNKGMDGVQFTRGPGLGGPGTRYAEWTDLRDVHPITHGEYQQWAVTVSRFKQSLRGCRVKTIDVERDRANRRLHRAELHLDQVVHVFTSDAWLGAEGERAA